MLRELRDDGPAAKNHHVLARLFLHGLDRARIELAEEAGILPRHLLPGLGKYQFVRVVYPVYHRTQLWSPPSRAMRVRRRAGVIEHVRPEAFEHLVRPAPEEVGVGTRHAVRRRLVDLRLRDDPVELP